MRTIAFASLVGAASAAAPSATDYNVLVMGGTFCVCVLLPLSLPALLRAPPSPRPHRSPTHFATTTSFRLGRRWIRAVHDEGGDLDGGCDGGVGGEVFSPVGPRPRRQLLFERREERVRLSLPGHV